MTVIAAYIVTDSDKHFLCIIDHDKKFHRFEISTGNASRLALESAAIVHKAIAKGE